MFEHLFFLLDIESYDCLKSLIYSTSILCMCNCGSLYFMSNIVLWF